jgi:hypothetical protein
VPGEIFRNNPQLVHAVVEKLGTSHLSDELYLMNWPKWRTLNTIHLIINQRDYLDPDSSIKEFNEENIQTYNFTYGFMCRDILRKIKKLIKKKASSFENRDD